MEASRFPREQAYRWVLLAGVLATLAILVVSSQGLWFYFDEWAIIRDRALDLDSLIRPHNEHFVAGLVLVHRGLVDLFGTDSYVPFLIALYASHLALAGATFLLLREDGTAWQATAGTLVILLPGAGGQNLVTAFQFGFLVATALGCIALAQCLRRPWLAALALTAAVATTGVGLFYLVATAVRMLGHRSIAVLAIPIFVYAAWFLATGSAAIGSQGRSDLMAIPAYVIAGVTAAAAQGFVVIGAIVVVLVITTIRRRITDRLVLASVAGLLAMFVITGIVRAQLGIGQATESRYATVALPFVLVIVLAAWRSACERYSISRLGPWITVAAIVLGLVSFAMFRAGWPEILALDPAL